MLLRSTPSAARLLVVLLGGAVLAFLSLRASSHLRTLPWIPAPIAFWADSHGILRNTLAFFGFGLVAFPLLGCGWRVALALGVFSALLEVAQIWIPSRFFDLLDIIASLAGLALAWILVSGVRWLMFRP